MPRAELLVVVLAGLMAATASAQLVVERERPVIKITFQESVGWAQGGVEGANAVKFSKTGPQNRTLVERGAYGWKGPNDRALCADAFSFSATNFDPDGDGPKAKGDWTGFEDANGDGDLSDEISVITGFLWVNGAMPGSESPLGGNAEAWAFRIGGFKNFDGNFADSSMVMRVANRTGGEVRQWSFRMKAWMNDADQNVSTLSVHVSGDNQTYHPLSEWAGAATEGQWSGPHELGGPFEAAVPDGGFFYIRISNTRPSGSGTCFLIDDLEITANPGPQSYAASWP